MESIEKGWPVLKERQEERAEGRELGKTEKVRRGEHHHKSRYYPLCGFRGINQTDSRRIQLH